jgi:hypothetical protein
MMMKIATPRWTAAFVLALTVAAIACSRPAGALRSDAARPSDSAQVPATAADTGRPCVPDTALERATRSVTGPFLFEGASWTCSIGSGATVSVIAHVDPDTAEFITLRTLRVVGQTDRGQTLDFGHGIIGVGPLTDLHTIDIDGDGFRDLQLDVGQGRGANLLSYIWRYDPESKRLVFERTLDGFMNVWPTRKSCIRTGGITAYNQSDDAEYCRVNGTWTEMSRRERRLDESTGVAVVRRYERRGDMLVLVKTDTVREQR